MSILSWIKIGGAVILLGVCGYYVWSYQHMKGQITALQTEIEGLKLRAKIIEKAQEATDAFMKKKTIVQVQVVKEKANVDQVVESKDSSAMQRLFLDRGMLVAPKTGVAAGRPPGRAGNISR